jgi:hypothetical protein
LILREIANSLLREKIKENCGKRIERRRAAREASSTGKRRQKGRLSREIG